MGVYVAGIPVFSLERGRRGPDACVSRVGIKVRKESIYNVTAPNASDGADDEGRRLGQVGKAVETTTTRSDSFLSRSLRYQHRTTLARTLRSHPVVSIRLSYRQYKPLPSGLAVCSRERHPDRFVGVVMGC